MLHDFPFTIRDVAELCGLGNGIEKYPNRVSIDINCPFCGGKKKMNLNLKKDVFGCNRCGEKGGMLALYGKIFGVDSQTAYEEITGKLGNGNIRKPGSSCIAAKNIKIEKDQEQEVSDWIKNQAYTSLLSMLPLSDTHKGKLLERGLTEDQIGQNGYRSTPVFGFRKITEKILESGCRIEGVPGFHVDPEGRWTIHFSQKSSGILIPIRNTQGLITGMQIRLDRPYDGRKYVWLSSVNFPRGASSGSPVHLAGKAGDRIVYITEGALKGDIAHAVSGKTFVCVPGVNQYVNLEPFLRRMKELGSLQVYDAYDMDKFLRPVCRGDYNDKCCFCEHYRRKQEYGTITCEKKQIKQENIQRGCRKLAELCRRLELPERMLVWDTDENGEWAERVKGVDDYLVGLQKRDRKEP